MQDALITWHRDDLPTVHLPENIRLSNRHVLKEDRSITIDRLLVDGDSNTKLAKGSKRGWITAGLALAPHRLSGYQTCPNSTAACRAACIDITGMRYAFPSIHIGKIARTLLYFRHREWFLDKLDRELTALVNDNPDADIAARLNLVTDLDYIKTIARHPRIEFYDYTKVAKRTGQRLPNYWVTLSRSGTATNQQHCIDQLAQGHNIAVVVGSRVAYLLLQLPSEYLGHPVIDGDLHDLRFLDDRGSVVGLHLKAASHALYRATEQTPFVVSV